MKVHFLSIKQTATDTSSHYSSSLFRSFHDFLTVHFVDCHTNYCHHTCQIGKNMSYRVLMSIVIVFLSYARYSLNSYARTVAFFIDRKNSPGLQMRKSNQRSNGLHFWGYLGWNNKNRTLQIGFMLTAFSPFQLSFIFQSSHNKVLPIVGIIR